MKVNAIKIICVVLTFVAISGFFHFYFEKEGDGDVFYHFKHAEIYAERGIFYDEFPWLPYTIIGQNNSDQWYGFHLLLVPFTYFGDPADGSGAGPADDGASRIFGLKLAGVFITTALLLLFYFSLKILKTGREFYWTLFMLFSAPPVTFHLLLIRPHVLSTGFAALLFAMLVSGYGNLSVFAVSFLLTWLHPNMFWLPILIVGVILFTKYYQEKILIWKKILSVMAGAIVGLLATPNPIGSIKTIFIEVFGSPLAGLSGANLNPGEELLPMAWSDIWIFFFFITFWLYALTIAYRKRYYELAPISGLILSIIFLLMTLVLVRRSMDLWVAYGMIFGAMIFSSYIGTFAQKMERRIALNSLMAVLLVFMIFICGNILAKKNKNIIWDINDFRGASKWMADNSFYGNMVLNPSWDDFAYLIYWNDKNRYAGGTDPFLLYAANKQLWVLAELVRLGEDGYAKEAVEKFGAKFIFITKAKGGRLYSNLLENGDFALGYEDDKTAVFMLKNQ